VCALVPAAQPDDQSARAQTAPHPPVHAHQPTFAQLSSASGKRLAREKRESERGGEMAENTASAGSRNLGKRGEARGKRLVSPAGGPVRPKRRHLPGQSGAERPDGAASGACRRSSRGWRGYGSCSRPGTPGADSGRCSTAAKGLFPGGGVVFLLLRLLLQFLFSLGCLLWHTRGVRRRKSSGVAQEKLLPPPPLEEKNAEQRGKNETEKRFGE
jgi:hypothetical protein